MERELLEAQRQRASSARSWRRARSATARYGDSVYLVEPQLKEGEGGLRDIHTALWLAKVKYVDPATSPSWCEKGVLTEREHAEIEAARDFLWRVRNALHFLTGQHQDQLTFEYQERIAADLGYRDDGTQKGVEQFMRAYYLHARDGESLLRRHHRALPRAPEAVPAARRAWAAARSAPACASPAASSSSAIRRRLPRRSDAAAAGLRRCAAPRRAAQRRQPRARSAPAPA